MVSYSIHVILVLNLNFIATELTLQLNWSVNKDINCKSTSDSEYDSRLQWPSTKKELGVG